MTRIGIIRHGSTVWNKEGRAQGSSDIPLNEDGLSEAQRLAERMSQEKWDCIYSSNLIRARQTAEIIGKRLDIPVHSDTRLREIDGGQIEGTTEQERILKWGTGWRELNLGIESSEGVRLRAVSFIEEAIPKHQNQNILIVSHGIFISYFLKEIVPHVNLEKRLNNTSLTKLFRSTDQWDCELYNCTLHLE